MINVSPVLERLLSWWADRGAVLRSVTIAVAVMSGSLFAWFSDPVSGVVAALAVLGLIAWWPIAVIVVLLLVAQEIDPDSGYDGLATLGHQLYFMGRFPAMLPLAVVAAAVAFVRGRSLTKLRLTAAGKIALGIAAALVIVTGIVALIHGASLLSAFNQHSRPFALLLFGVLLGLMLHVLPREVRMVQAGTAAAFYALLALAVVAVAVGWSADPRISSYFLFYASALPAVASALLLALLLGDWGDARLVMATVAFAAVIITLTSFRRNVWLAAAAVLLIAVLVHRARRAILRRIGFMTVGLSLVLLVWPGLRAAVSERVLGAIAVLGGQASDSSTQGHIADLVIGWSHVKRNFWTGIGPDAPQLPGFAASGSARIYVHNEWLLDWLRFGLIGPVLVTLLVALMVVMAVSVLRNDDGNLVVRTAALFALIAPLCMMTAPFLSTTSGWPLLVGLSVGVLAVQPSALPRMRIPHRGRERDHLASATIQDVNLVRKTEALKPEA